MDLAVHRLHAPQLPPFHIPHRTRLPRHRPPLSIPRRLNSAILHHNHDPRNRNPPNHLRYLQPLKRLLQLPLPHLRLLPATHRPRPLTARYRPITRVRRRHHNRVPAPPLWTAAAAYRQPVGVQTWTAGVRGSVLGDAVCGVH